MILLQHGDPAFVAIPAEILDSVRRLASEKMVADRDLAMGCPIPGRLVFMTRWPPWFGAFRYQPVIVKPRRSESKSHVERTIGYLETLFLPEQRGTARVRPNRGPTRIPTPCVAFESEGLCDPARGRSSRSRLDVGYCFGFATAYAVLALGRLSRRGTER